MSFLLHFYDHPPLVKTCIHNSKNPEIICSSLGFRLLSRIIRLVLVSKNHETNQTSCRLTWLYKAVWKGRFTPLRLTNYTKCGLMIANWQNRRRCNVHHVNELFSHGLFKSKLIFPLFLLFIFTSFDNYKYGRGVIWPGGWEECICPTLDFKVSIGLAAGSMWAGYCTPRAFTVIQYTSNNLR